MYKAGASIYIGLSDYSLEDNLNYLNKLKSLNINHIFSSFHINEANNTNEELQIILNKCKELDLKLSLDVSKKSYLELNNIDDIYSLRLDYGFNDDEIIELSKKHLIELNASTIKKDYLIKLIKLGLNENNTILSFNFYPKKYSGHDLAFVESKSQEFKELGFKVAGFIPSHKNYRPPLYEGLPTIETHRYLSLHLAIEELKLCKLDYIYFGDAIIDDEELNILKMHEVEEVLLKVNNYLKSDSYDIYNKIYNNRSDYNSYIIRISTRTSYIEKSNNIKREIGSLTIDNYLFKRYCGEINIVLKELEADERVNVIGKIEYTPFILDKIKEGIKFKFI